MNDEPPADGANATVAEVVAQALHRHGVELTFGQSIPSAFHLAASDIGIRQIGYRTENAGAVMADGYARMTNRIGVVTAQNGPAATLLVPGLAESLKSSIPVLALVQDVPTPTIDRNAFQEFDHLELFRPVAKWVRRCADPARIDDYVDMAIAAATGGRGGPAVLLIPMNVFSARVAPTGRRAASLGHFPLDRTVAEPAAVARAADLLAAAERPLVMAGGGVHLSAAHDVLAALQEEAALPVATSIMGKGAVDERHPLSIGVAGHIMGVRGMARHLRSMFDEADVILLVGTRTDQNVTDDWTLFPPTATLVHLDIDGVEIGRNHEAVRLAGDAGATLEALRTALAQRDLGKRRAARAAVEARIAAARADHAEEARPMTGSAARPIRPERVMAEVARQLTTDSIIVSDASFSHVWTANYLPALRPGMRILQPRGLAGLGWGLPMAIGAKLAAPASPVLVFAGDGGFAHVWSELETSRRMDVPVVMTVFNNQVLGFQALAENQRYGRHTDACDFAPVDHAAIAEACGCHGVRIEGPNDYAAALRAALSADRTTVIDVITDPQAFPPITLFDDRAGGG